jgi:hypothetical protein
MTAVTSDSAILQLPDSIEVKIPVHADHSQIVKFDNKNADTYQAALGYLKQFEKDAGKIISSRFGMWVQVRHRCSLYLCFSYNLHLRAI